MIQHIPTIIKSNPYSLGCPGQVNVGDVCTLKITTMVQPNVGIDDTTYPILVFVPNVCVGSVIQARIVRKKNHFLIAQSVHVLLLNNSQYILKQSDILSRSVEDFIAPKGRSSVLNKNKRIYLHHMSEMVANGLHFGERNSHDLLKNQKVYSLPNKQPNPQEQPQLFHQISILKTRRCLNKALDLFTIYALKERTFIFISTHTIALDLVKRASYFTQNSFYLNTRWLNGMLTNWKTLSKKDPTNKKAHLAKFLGSSSLSTSNQSKRNVDFFNLNPFSKHVAIVIGQQQSELKAIRECRKLGIKIFTIVDTDCDPTLSDYIIPANNDSFASVKYVLHQLITRLVLIENIKSSRTTINEFFN